MSPKPMGLVVTLGMALVIAIRVALRAAPTAHPPKKGPAAPKLDLRWNIVVIAVGTLFVLAYGALLRFLLEQVQKTTDRFFRDYGAAEGIGDWLWKLPWEVIVSHGSLLLVIPLGLALANFLRIWHRGTYRYQIEVWLGEIARRIYAAYDVEWPLVAQVTRYRPFAWVTHWRKPFRRGYRLRAKDLGSLGSRLEFEIRVSTTKGEPMEVWERVRGEGKLRLVAPLPNSTRLTTVSPDSSVHTHRRIRG